MLLIILYSLVDKLPRASSSLKMTPTFLLDAQGRKYHHVPCFPLDILPNVSKTLFSAHVFLTKQRNISLFNVKANKEVNL